MAYGEINGWKIEDPSWEGYSKHICVESHHWTGIYISGFYINIDNKDRYDRIMASYPNIAKHFYYVYLNNRDIYFASYDINEVKRFITTFVPEHLWRSQYFCRIWDCVEKTNVDNNILFEEV